MSKTKSVSKNNDDVSYKAISHFEKMNNPNYRYKYNQRLMQRCEIVSSNEVDKVTKKMLPVTKKRVIVGDELSKFKVSDFSLENQLAIGASLNPTSLSRGILDTTDRIESTVSSYLLRESKNNNNNNKTE